VSVNDNVSVLSGDRSRIFTGLGTCKSPFLLLLLLRLRAAEVGDRRFGVRGADGEACSACSESFGDGDDDDDESVGVSGVVVVLLQNEPGIKSCSQTKP
jgi:hypothetical protein